MDIAQLAHAVDECILCHGGYSDALCSCDVGEDSCFQSAVPLQQLILLLREKRLYPSSDLISPDLISSDLISTDLIPSEPSGSEGGRCEPTQFAAQLRPSD